MVSDSLRSGTRRTEMVNIREEERMDWSQCPVDLLQRILRHLSILDHLSFRGVCKTWRSSSLQSPSQNQPKSQPHWLIFSNKSTTTLQFGNSSTRRLYTVHLPELTGIKTKCLLSTHGWLLLAHVEEPPSLFFFNPFSRARIDLPCYKNFIYSIFDKQNKPAFALSASPTSPDCTIFSVAYLNQDTIQITTCRRGEKDWTIKKYKRKGKLFYRIKRAVFSDGILYWVDSEGNIRAFRAETGTWFGLKMPITLSSNYFFESFYSINYLMEELDGETMMCICFREFRTGQHVVFEIHRHGERAKLIVMEDEDKERYLVEYYGKEATHVPGWLRPDTFSVGAWCVESFNSKDEHGDDKQYFSWHLLYRPGCKKKCDCKKSVWIEPKWINPSPTLAWTA